MNLKLANWIIGTMKFDSEIFDFIICENFNLNVCTLGIPEIRDLEMLDELSFLTRESHKDIFEIALETKLWRKILKEESSNFEKDSIELSESEVKVYA
jgi:hypothetical protein